MRQTICFMCLVLTACSGGSAGNSIEPPPKPISCGSIENEDSSSLLISSIATEVEPNDDFSTANALFIQNPPRPEDRVGASVQGHVTDTADATDTFSFTAQRTAGYYFKLCESFCVNRFPTNNAFPDSLDVSIAYFEILDESGNVLMTTLANDPTENYGQLCIDAGVIKYMAVYANNTMNVAQEYHAVVTEIIVWPRR